ncbi:ComEC/Rec2 family competence protein [Natronorarus salvus]|uniref:ComEC/Rec2 family competence protein n=1 Tax=Natronorarus salvus TaxID=3117733 RepID=UPI002F262A7B
MRSHLLVVVVALCLVLAGCAGEDVTNGDETPEETETPEGIEDAADDADDAADGVDDGDAEADDGTAEEVDTAVDSDDEDPASDADAEDGAEANEGTEANDEQSPDEETPDDTTDAEEETETEPVDGSVEVHMIDVGQADATLIIGPGGETMLIDTGDWRQDGSGVIEYLEGEGIDRIDYLVATHGHADHIGGHAAVIEHFETEGDGIGQAWDSGVPHTSATYDRYLDAVEEHEVDLIDAQEGDEIPIEGVDVQVLNPPAESDRPDDLHYNSLSVHLAFGETAFLFTGDAEEDAEARMVDAHGDELAADVYHAGHHGSATSSTPAFLDSVEPEIALISAAYESQYGHPHDEVLDAFADRGIESYWTAVHGTVVIESDGSDLAVETESEATTDPLALYDESEATVSAPPVSPIAWETDATWLPGPAVIA